MQHGSTAGSHSVYPMTGRSCCALNVWIRSQRPHSLCTTLPRPALRGFHGQARFVGPTTVAVGNDLLAGNRVLITAGARPAALPFPGVAHLTTSDQFLELEALPPRLIFVGRGYISFECAHVAVRAGVHVTLLHRGARPLKGFEPELVDQLVQRTGALGVHVELSTAVCGLDKTGNGVVVRALTEGTERRFAAERRCMARGGCRRSTISTSRPLG